MALESMNVSLPSGLKRFVERRVTEGGYRNSNEYFGELVRRDQERLDSAFPDDELIRRHEALNVRSMEHLAELIDEGLESGPAVELTKDDWSRLYDQVQQIGERHHTSTAK